MPMFRTWISIQFTPRSKTKNQVRELDLDKKRASAVRKRLLLSNTILHCLKPKIRMKKRTGDPVIMSKSIKKYRCTSNLSKEFGVGRQKIRDAIKLMSVQYKQEVIDYLERPDYSTTLTGKKDNWKRGETETCPK